MAELDKPLEGAALYDKLYAGGYHNDLRLSHGLYLMYDLTEVAAWYNLTSVLDVGCSHGLVVESLWVHGGLTASGVDVSTRAVEIASQQRLKCKPPAGKCLLSADDTL